MFKKIKNALVSPLIKCGSDVYYINNNIEGIVKNILSKEDELNEIAISKNYEPMFMVEFIKNKMSLDYVKSDNTYSYFKLIS